MATRSFLTHSTAPFSSLKEYQIDGLLVQSQRAMQAVSHLSAQNLQLLKTAAAKAYTAPLASPCLSPLFCFDHLSVDIQNSTQKIDNLFNSSIIILLFQR